MALLKSIPLERFAVYLPHIPQAWKDDVGLTGEEEIINVAGGEEV